jgi:hypothetical protein
VTWIAPGLVPGGAPNSQTTAATPSSRPTYPTAYAFANRSMGWAVVGRPEGGSTIFKTEDGGKHWRLLATLVGNWTGIIQFFDTTHGFVFTTHPNQIYRTSDGGAHWVPVAIPQGQTLGIFADARHGWSIVPPVGPGKAPTLYLTSDGGDTWGHVADLPRDSFGPVFRGPDAWLGAGGYTAGRLHVYASFDGGLSWSPREVPRPSTLRSEAANPPSFYAGVVGLFPGAGVVVFVSTGPNCQTTAGQCGPYETAEFTSFDGGNTWAYVPPPPGEYFDIGYEDARHWWVAVGGSLFKSSDGGQTWTLVSNQMPPGRYSFHFFDSQHAWVHVSTSLVNSQDPDQVRGYASALLFTSDGGRHWVRANPPLAAAVS